MSVWETKADGEKHVTMQFNGAHTVRYSLNSLTFQNKSVQLSITELKLEKCK